MSDENKIDPNATNPKDSLFYQMAKDNTNPKPPNQEPSTKELSVELLWLILGADPKSALAKTNKLAASRLESQQLEIKELKRGIEKLLRLPDYHASRIKELEDGHTQKEKEFFDRHGVWEKDVELHDFMEKRNHPTLVSSDYDGAAWVTVRIKDYRSLADENTSLQSQLKASQSALEICENTLIEGRN